MSFMLEALQSRRIGRIKRQAKLIATSRRSGGSRDL
jgi:hypothetical protein